jgi:hypothetical protein
MISLRVSFSVGLWMMAALLFNIAVLTNNVYSFAIGCLLIVFSIFLLYQSRKNFHPIDISFLNKISWYFLMISSIFVAYSLLAEEFMPLLAAIFLSSTLLFAFLITRIYNDQDRYFQEKSKFYKSGQLLKPQINIANGDDTPNIAEIANHLHQVTDSDWEDFLQECRSERK